MKITLCSFTFVIIFIFIARYVREPVRPLRSTQELYFFTNFS